MNPIAKSVLKAGQRVVTELAKEAEKNVGPQLKATAQRLGNDLLNSGLGNLKTRVNAKFGSIPASFGGMAPRPSMQETFSKLQSRLNTFAAHVNNVTPGPAPSRPTQFQAGSGGTRPNVPPRPGAAPAHGRPAQAAPQQAQRPDTRYSTGNLGRYDPRPTAEERAAMAAQAESAHDAPPARRPDSAYGTGNLGRYDPRPDPAQTAQAAQAAPAPAQPASSRPITHGDTPPPVPPKPEAATLPSAQAKPSIPANLRPGARPSSTHRPAAPPKGWRAEAANLLGVSLEGDLRSLLKLPPDTFDSAAHFAKAQNSTEPNAFDELRKSLAESERKIGPHAEWLKAGYAAQSAQLGHPPELVAEVKKLMDAAAREASVILNVMIDMAAKSHLIQVTVAAPDATDADVNKARKKAQLESHPDKVAAAYVKAHGGMPTSDPGKQELIALQEAASAKAQVINDAWAAHEDRLKRET